MEFTFGLVEHFLRASGIEVAHEPRGAGRTFRIAAAPVGLPQSSHALAIYSSIADTRGMDASIPLLIVCPDAAAAEQAAMRNPGALVVTSGKSPSWLCESINLRLSEVVAWVEQMDGIIEAGGHAAELLESSEPVLGRYLGLNDALYRRVATTPHIAPIERYSEVFVETGQYPANGIREIEALAAREKWDEQFRTVVNQHGNAINPFPNASRVFRLNGHYAAHLVMVSEQEIDAGEVFLFDLLADKMGALLDKEWKEHDPYKQPYTRFLDRILSAPVHDHARFAAQAKRLSLPTQGVFEVCAIAGAQNRGGLNHLTREIQLALTGTWALICGDRIYVLLHAPERGAGQIAAAERQLFEFADRLGAEIGVSDRFDDPEFAHLGRLEADIALRYGHRSNANYGVLEDTDPFLHTAFRFKRYLPYYLVDPQADTGEFIAEFEKSPHPLNKIRAADKEHGTQDFSLLRVYLYFDCNAKRTAEAMHMHRNTVDYRLKRIRKVYHVDLDDNDTRLVFHYLFGILD